MKVTVPRGSRSVPLYAVQRGECVQPVSKIHQQDPDGSIHIVTHVTPDYVPNRMMGGGRTCLVNLMTGRVSWVLDSTPVICLNAEVVVSKEGYRGF